MMNWIINNSYWIFSGIGIVIAKIVFNFFRTQKGKKNDKKYCVKEERYIDFSLRIGRR